MTTTLSGGRVTLFLLFDVAEAIDLGVVRTLVSEMVEARLVQKAAAPGYVDYAQPPLTIDGPALGIAAVDGFEIRFKLFDYGVVSVALSQALPDDWEELLRRGADWHDNTVLTAEAEARCRQLLARVRPALNKPRETFLSEDYLVFAVNAEPGVTSDALVRDHGDDIARLLRGEREPLSRQEREAVLGQGFSYLASDLVVPGWNAAFVYDSEPGVRAALEILEFANSQLLEFRYYDRLLDGQLASIYQELQAPAGWLANWHGRRHTRAARRVHALFIDVNELIERTENALKVVGDVWAARLFTRVAGRLGLDRWRTSVREKLKTLDAIHNFTVQQTSMARGEFLELSIVLILVFELVLFFIGVME